MSLWNDRAVDLAEAEGWIDLARRKGVYELHVAPEGVRFVLGPPVAAPASPGQAAKEEEPTYHPADLIERPPDLRPDPEAA